MTELSPPPPVVLDYTPHYAPHSTIAAAMFPVIIGAVLLQKIFRDALAAGRGGHSWRVT